MKKSVFLLLTILIASLSLFSCSSSIESDAKRMAELQCKAMELMERVMEGDESVAEDSKKFGLEVQKMSEEIEEKYTSEKDKEVFAEAFYIALGNCE